MNATDRGDTTAPAGSEEHQQLDYMLDRSALCLRATG